MISSSRRIRVTLAGQEFGYLHWLAVESGLTEQAEAALLLQMGIRLAMRRYRRLYGGLPMDVADQQALEANTPKDRGDKRPERWVELPHHHPVGRYHVDLGDPPLTLPEWARPPAQTPHRENGFAGHGQEDSE